MPAQTPKDSREGPFRNTNLNYYQLFFSLIDDFKLIFLKEDKITLSKGIFGEVETVPLAVEIIASVDVPKEC